MLGKFGLTGKIATQPLGSLSGGQRVRVSLASITWARPSILLLDEPTNHCDMGALGALSSSLESFEGAVVVVSHNRAFLRDCCSELWVVGGGRVRVRKGEESFGTMFDDYVDRVFKSKGGVSVGDGEMGGAGGVGANVFSGKGGFII